MPTILCIDDDPLCLETEKALLESNGYKVFTALNGSSGIALARKHTFDVVVLDFNMPGMDGNHVAQALKTEHPVLPVVIWSGSAYETQESLKWFADKLLHKGDGPVAFLSAIDSIMNLDAKKRPSKVGTTIEGVGAA